MAVKMKTVALRPETHRELKLLAARKGLTMEDAVRQLLSLPSLRPAALHGAQPRPGRPPRYRWRELDQPCMAMWYPFDWDEALERWPDGPFAPGAARSFERAPDSVTGYHMGHVIESHMAHVRGLPGWLYVHRDNKAARRVGAHLPDGVVPGVPFRLE